MADYTAEGVREWLAEAPARQAHDDAIAAEQRAHMAARGETMADSLARWERERLRVADRVMGRRVAEEIAPHAAKRRARVTDTLSMSLPGFS